MNDQFYSIHYKFVQKLIEEIERRFCQKTLTNLSILTDILLDPVNNSSSAEIVEICTKFGLNNDKIQLEMSLFRQLENIPTEFLEFVQFFQNLNSDVHKMLPEIKKLIKLLLVVPSSTASAERSFSMLRRLKTYLRSTMTQVRLNSLVIMHSYSDDLASIPVSSILKEFVSRNSYRLSQFGDI